MRSIRSSSISRNFERLMRGAGRIEQEMNAAEAVERELDHVLDRGALGDVDGQRQRLGADRVDLLSRFLDTLFVDVGADDVGALAGKNQRGGAADAAAGARNDDGLSRESSPAFSAWYSPLGVMPLSRIMDCPAHRVSGNDRWHVA